jgi:hypothetical protein
VQCRKMSNVLTQWDRNLMNATSIWIPSLRFAIEVPFFLPFGHPSQIYCFLLFKTYDTGNLKKVGPCTVPLSLLQET